MMELASAGCTCLYDLSGQPKRTPNPFLDCSLHPKPTTPGLKNDAGKTRFDLLPPRALWAVADVITFGATKYGPDNWRGVERQRWFAAAMRHLWAWMLGEKRDPESGLPHLAHAACSILFLLDIDEEYPCLQSPKSP